MKSENKNHPKGSRKIIISRSSYILGMLIIFVLSSLFFSSCRKKEKEIIEEDTEQNTAADNNLAESFVADIESMGSQVSDNGSLSTFKLSGANSIEALEASSCAVITITGQVVTIDFGTTGCVGSDGRSRTGKLIYDFSGSASGSIHYRNPGFTMNVSSQNYTVDNYTINIVNKTIVNTTPITIPTSVNPGTNLTWTIVGNLNILKPGGGSITWSCNRTKELLNTNDSLCYKGQAYAIDWRKAIVKLNGSASGLNANNETYSSVATNLIRDFNCAPEPILRPHRHPFISGIVVYTPASRPVRTIDFGNGACDMLATVTIKGRVFTMNLP